MENYSKEITKEATETFVFFFFMIYLTFELKLCIFSYNIVRAIVMATCIHLWIRRLNGKLDHKISIFIATAISKKNPLVVVSPGFFIYISFNLLYGQPLAIIDLNSSNAFTNCLNDMQCVRNCKREAFCLQFCCKLQHGQSYTMQMIHFKSGPPNRNLHLDCTDRHT